MHHRKNWGTVLLLTLAVLAGIFCGCQGETGTSAPAQTPPPTVAETDPADFVVFSPEDPENELSLPVSEVLAYESRYADCTGTWYRDQLEEEDRLIYNACLYAMEHCHTKFRLYVQDNQKDFSHIREALCLDSPFLEQNIHPDTEIVTIWSGDPHGDRIDFEMKQFTPEQWSLKLDALAACRSIVAGIPESCTTQEAKMEYLYRYVCDHVAYVPYDGTREAAYLYDAVCRGQTICDGYSNMLHLLFRLIGVESVEAMGSLSPDAGEAQSADGHTWVVARLGDTFYNFDPTHDDSSEGFGDGRLFYFGVSDERLTVDQLHFEDLRPKCPDTSRDYAFADLVIEDIGNNDQILSAAQLIDRHISDGIDTTMLLVKGVLSQKDLDGFMDRCIGKTQRVRQLSMSVVLLEELSLIEVTAQKR